MLQNKKCVVIDNLLQNKRCVVIDLDETLVHSSFTPVPNADFIIPVDLDGTIHEVTKHSLIPKQ